MSLKSTFAKLLNATRAASAQIKQSVGDLRDKRLSILDEIDRIQSLPALREEVISAIDHGLRPDDSRWTARCLYASAYAQP